ncbi:FRG domain-containing protein [Bacillus cereus]|uniref:FRG domain-containing protein n=1 Tax=Bacillus cereus TaxID=1396 RepID=UPI000B439FC9|nr:MULTISPECIES: FRG domain-containing protein [Bacillus cereus group]MBH0346350.1 hypothetical protein [Bacillus thuringiensis]OTY05304.1 FRG domain-containing protein [Bacillus thuringiensis serovar muju]PEY43149.1 FRG domain-containing protein [Bacillus cereus]PGK09691.1 FRG domain-containing protein [Bacillus cereus]
MVATQVKQKIFTDEWNRILEEVAEFRRNSKSNWIWFRGHGDENYLLDSGLFRVRQSNERLSLLEYRLLEARIFNSFTSQATTFVNEDSIDILFYMQHYGVKTRLLDWTESFGTALYFAFDSWNYNDNKQACIWLLDPNALNEYFGKGLSVYLPGYFKDQGIRIISEMFGKQDTQGKLFNNNSFAMYPMKNNQRLLSQRGFFTVQGNLLLDLEQEIEQICPDEKDKIIKKIILPTDLVENVYEYLTINGINDFTIFNDTDGLGKSINKEYIDYAYDERLSSIVNNSLFKL